MMESDCDTLQMMASFVRLPLLCWQNNKTSAFIVIYAGKLHSIPLHIRSCNLPASHRGLRRKRAAEIRPKLMFSLILGTATLLALPLVLMRFKSHPRLVDLSWPTRRLLFKVFSAVGPVGREGLDPGSLMRVSKTNLTLAFAVWAARLALRCECKWKKWERVQNRTSYLDDSHCTLLVASSVCSSLLSRAVTSPLYSNTRISVHKRMWTSELGGLAEGLNEWCTLGICSLWRPVQTLRGPSATFLPMRPQHAVQTVHQQPHS